MKWLAILNPHAGNNGNSCAQQLIKQLEEKVGACCVLTTHCNHSFSHRSRASRTRWLHRRGGRRSHLGGRERIATQFALHRHRAGRHQQRSGPRFALEYRRGGPGGFSTTSLSTGGYHLRPLSAKGHLAGTENDQHFRPGLYCRRDGSCISVQTPTLHVFSHFVGAAWQIFRQTEFPVRLQSMTNHGRSRW